MAPDSEENSQDGEPPSRGLPLSLLAEPTLVPRRRITARRRPHNGNGSSVAVAEIAASPQPSIRTSPLSVRLFLQSGTNERTEAFRRIHYPGATVAEWNDWRWHSRNRLRHLEEISRIIRLTEDETLALRQGGAMLPVGITPYYMSLIDGENPDDPIRRTVIPTTNEFVRGPGEADDPLGEDGDCHPEGL